MKLKVRVALENSISHWKQNKRARWQKDINISQSACAFCSLYLIRFCHDCPVMKDSKVPGCKNTPYIAVRNYVRWRYSSYRCHIFKFLPLGRKWRKLCQEEIDFLKSLRD